ncbi:hypothetical protein AV530_015807 [Patagioenas fasciata monilis]|uniref:Uncharacterized protein n=1 Tax=Patagioenas fasciata monilis TaxID=372326 RepID=A0A1V4KIV8_PATFA|nr:hypothetical protein AV530_015807 [Patagioenas fasciata monilis]
MPTVAACEAVGEQLSHVRPLPTPWPARPDTRRRKVPPLTPPSCPRSRAAGPGGRAPQQPRARSGGGRRRRTRAGPHEVLGRAAAGAGADLPRAALHRRQREAAAGRRAEPLPEPDKNLVSESSYEV